MPSVPKKPARPRGPSADAVVHAQAAPAPSGARDARSAETRARIFAAARELFVSEGLSGSPMETIAARAGVNKRMVYHHFGRRDDLFTAVLEDAYASIRAAEQGLRLDELEPLDGFRRLVAFNWEYFLEHPEFLALVNQENLHKARHIRSSERISVLSSSLVGLIRTLLERGVARGVCRPGIDPVHLWITIAAMAWFYIANTHTISVTFGRNMLSPAQRRKRLEHMTEVVLAYVRLPAD